MVSSNYCLERTQGMAHISYNDNCCIPWELRLDLVVDRAEVLLKDPLGH